MIYDTIPTAFCVLVNHTILSAFLCTGEKLLKLLLWASLLFINFFISFILVYMILLFILFYFIARDSVFCFRRQKQGDFFESIKYY